MSTPATEIATYALDPAHTTVEFVVRHLMITKVRGRFAGVTGSI
ncbi:MAG: YceI family protein, partial [Candidatus Eremiobacteraeota bacterium]|nr:YceI family protein [Candidatus Eremiobacteraeota bacterium]